MTWFSLSPKKSKTTVRRSFQPQVEALDQRLLPSATAPRVVLSDDHGNTIAQATSIAVNTSVSGNIDMKYDKDWFKFRAVAGVQYNLETRLAGMSDTVLGLYDGAGKQLAFNDDRAGSSDRSSFIRWTAPQDGDFSLLATGYSTKTGSYSVKATPIDDHGNSISSATALVLNKPTAGIIHQAYDNDYFKFSAVPGMTYVLETRAGSVADTELTLYDSNGKKIGYDDDNGEGRSSRLLWTAMNSGTYYLKVNGYGARTGGYTVVVNTIIARPIVATPAATTKDLTPTLTWNKAYGAATYDIEVTDLTTGKKIISQRGISGTSFTTTKLEAEHRYSYAVRAVNNQGFASVWSGTQTFAIESAKIGAPSLISPKGSVDTKTPTLKWTAVDKAVKYEVVVTERQSGATVASATVRGATSYTTPVLREGRSFTWSVRAVSETDTYGNWASAQFKTVGVPTLKPVWYQETASGLHWRGSDFTWTAVQGAERYEVWVDDLTTGEKGVKWNNDVRGTSVYFSFSDAELIAGHKYAFYVRAISDALVDGDWSTGMQFTVGEQQGDWETVQEPPQVIVLPW